MITLSWCFYCGKLLTFVNRRTSQNECYRTYQLLLDTFWYLCLTAIFRYHRLSDKNSHLYSWLKHIIRGATTRHFSLCSVRQRFSSHESSRFHWPSNQSLTNFRNLTTFDLLTGQEFSYSEYENVECASWIYTFFKYNPGLDPFLLSCLSSLSRLSRSFPTSTLLSYSRARVVYFMSFPSFFFTKRRFSFKKTTENITILFFSNNSFILYRNKKKI